MAPGRWGQSEPDTTALVRKVRRLAQTGVQPYREGKIPSRSRSPTPLKPLIAPYVLDPEAHLVEPVRFEALRSARPSRPTLKRLPR